MTLNLPLIILFNAVILVAFWLIFDRLGYICNILDQFFEEEIKKTIVSYYIMLGKPSHWLCSCSHTSGTQSRDSTLNPHCRLSSKFPSRIHSFSLLRKCQQ